MITGDPQPELRFGDRVAGEVELRHLDGRSADHVGSFAVWLCSRCRRKQGEPDRPGRRGAQGSRDPGAQGGSVNRKQQE